MSVARKKRIELSSGIQQVSAPSPTEVEMVSYLDFCLDIRPEVEHFKSTICSHLTNVFKVSWEFEKVDWHIRRLWHDFGTPGAGNPDHHSVYHHGSRVLSCFQLDTHLGGQLRRRTDEIKQEKAGQRCIIPRSITRSVAKTLNLNNHLVLGEDVPEYSHWLGRPKIVVEIPMHQKRVLPEPSGVAHVLPPSAAMVADSEDPQTSSSFDSPFVSNTNALGVHEDCPEPILEQRTCTPYSTPSEFAQFGVTERRHQHESTDFERDRSYDDMVRWTKFLKNELASAREENAKAMATLDSLKKSSAELQRCDDREIAAKLIQSREEVYSLRKRLTNCELLEKFSVSRRQYPIGPERAEIYSDMSFIESGIRKLWMFADAERYSHDQTAVEGNRDLFQLWCRAFGSIEVTLHGSSLTDVLHSLASTAVVEWVFETELAEPHIANNHRSDVLLDHLVSLGVERFSRNLEFATLNTIIEGRYCERIVLPERAQRLSERLLTTLESLIMAQSMMRKGSRNNFGRFRKDFDKVISLLDTAVKLKAKLLVGDWEYESVLPQRGQHFHERTMRTERTAGLSSQVDMVLSPGLVRYVCLQGKVGCNNFRKAQSEPRDGFDCILPASTLTR